MLHFATFFWHTLALVTIVTAVHIGMLQGCPFPAESVTFKSSPFRLKFPRPEQRPELILLLLLPFLLQGKDLFRCSFSLLKVRNSKLRPLGQGNCASQPSRQCCNDAALWQCGGILSCPLGQSSLPLTEMVQSYIPPLLYITCASCLQEWYTESTTTTPSLQHHISYTDKWALYTKLQLHAFKWLHPLPPNPCYG